jgi:hypothetical protein
MNILARKLNILHHPLMFNCHADCHGPIDIRADEVMEIACLEPSNPIVRGDDRFKRFEAIPIFPHRNKNSNKQNDPSESSIPEYYVWKIKNRLSLY